MVIKHRQITLIKWILAVFYNTNTLIINPLIYLKFLVPFLILIFFSIYSKQLVVILLVYLLSISTYNLVYIINDYFDLKGDLKTNRKKSIVHLFNSNFKFPLTINFLLLALLVIILSFICKINFLLVFILILFVTILLVIVHSVFYKIKWLTFFLLRLLRISLPPFLLSFIYQKFSALLLFSLFVFPIYNFRSYISYLKLKALDSRNNYICGALLTIIVVLFALYFIIKQNRVYLFLMYVLLFISLEIIFSLIARFLSKPLLNLDFIKNTLITLGYKDLNQKLQELLQFVLYLLVFLLIFLFKLL